MIKLTVFHSGNPDLTRCQKVTGVAKEMKRRFQEAIALEIYTLDSHEAQYYELKSSAAVFVNDEFVPPDTALSVQEMEAFLKTGLNK